MQASKTPAYAALVVAVAAGAALSSGRHPSPPRTTPVDEKPQAQPLVAPAQASPSPVKATWRVMTLDWQHVRLKLDAPDQEGAAPNCHTPTGTQDEVGVCSRTMNEPQPVVWMVATVTQRDRFVPASWFADAQNSIKVTTQPRQIADGLNADLQASTSIALSNPTTLDAAWLKNGLALTGQATYRPNQASTGTVTMTCIAAYILAGNRPTQVLYCAQDSQEAQTGAGRMVESLRKLNPSLEEPKSSLQAMERATYRKLLKGGGGAAANPELVQTEVQHFATTSLDCQDYGAISQERFVCFEQHAKARLDQLNTLFLSG